jgi:DNA-binding LacI/PurR family transcriptional regulator/DNA-binding transcriptional regulator YhcF (GntR family)
LCNRIAQIAAPGHSARVQPIVKKALVDEVAEALRGRMASGELKGVLPGVRHLSRTLGVCVPTICRALHQLGADGELIGGGKSRRWRVPENRADSGERTKPDAVHSQDATVQAKRRARLLFLSAMSLSHERHAGVEVFAELLAHLGNSSWEVMHRVENFAAAVQPRKSWEKLLKLTKPDAIVALGGTPALAYWLRAKGIRALFIGGDPAESGVPVVAVRISTMLHYALDRLLSVGHRRILVPLCGRPPAFVARCHQVVAELSSQTKGRRENIVIAETTYARPEVVVDLLRRQWRKNPPDALIMLDSREFIAASGFFREADLEIPRDLSVVMLSQNPVMDWHLPSITHFEHPVKLMARTIAKWVMQGRVSYSPEAFMEVRARWVDGQSVLPRN